MTAPRSRRVTRVLFFLAACVLAFEEWIWDHASAVLRRIGRLLPFRWIEGWVRQRTPPQALALYVLPVLVVLPLKAVALGVMGHGRVVLGFAILFLDKVIGTAVLARLWQMTEPAITTYRLVRRGRDAFLRLRRRLYGWLHQQPVYRRTRALLQRMNRQGGLLAEWSEQLRRQRRRRALLPATAARAAKRR
jgi:hypothetical protein